jgi:hypothetical protein
VNAAIWPGWQDVSEIALEVRARADHVRVYVQRHEIATGARHEHSAWIATDRDTSRAHDRPIS